MINIPVDEAYAFDFLSILDVKRSLNSGETNFNFYKESIVAQIGEEKFNNILNSPQYRDLVLTNKRIFDYIEDIRKGKHLNAKIVDDANMARYMYKKELQAKFFSSELSEQKTTTSF